MSSDLSFEIQQRLSSKCPGRLAYTRQAFRMLPRLDTPRILDIGCGSGEPTLELARLSGGHVIGIDIDQRFLAELSAKIEREQLADCVEAVNQSLFDLEFPVESFDVIWAEASIHVIGFTTGLVQWRPYIKPDGFLVVHEMTWLLPDPPQEFSDHWRAVYPGIRSVPENLERIGACGYDLIGHFTLPVDLWSIEYYDPLQTLIDQLREKYAADAEALTLLAEQQREIDLYRKYQQWYGSAFFVMQKK